VAVTCTSSPTFTTIGTVARNAPVCVYWGELAPGAAVNGSKTMVTDEPTSPKIDWIASPVANEPMTVKVVSEFSRPAT
jgi:hypothetical protein